MSIDETRAREEVALLVSRFAHIGHCGQCVVVEPSEIAAILLDPKRFARLAGLLGYVKADSEEWAVEGSDPEPWTTGVIADGREYAEKLAGDYWGGRFGHCYQDAHVVRRLVGPWEVAG